MQAYHRVQLPASGVSHVLSVRLVATDEVAPSQRNVINHVITARGSLLQVWEVRETGSGAAARAKLHHLVTRRLHGHVTSLARIRTLASKLDGADRVLVSFKDAKMALLEWSPAAHDLIPVSLHTFEKLPQVAEGTAKAATDPASRISVLLLPSNTGGDGTLAVLPFFQEDIDLESIGMDAAAWGQEGAGSIPYAPSHLIPLASLTANQASMTGPSKSSTLTNAFVNPTGPPPIRNVIDMTFLPGFNEPTLAILYAPEETWAGRLENMSSNCLVSLVTLASDSDNVTSAESTTAVVIATSPSLPYSCRSLAACPPDLGGVLILTSNGVLHLEQGGKVVGVAANGWFEKEWSGPSLDDKRQETSTPEEFEGASVVFLSTDVAALFCRSGRVVEVLALSSGRSVTGLKLRTVGQGVPASCVERVRGRFGEQGYLIAGSETGETCLCKWIVEQRSASDPAAASNQDGLNGGRDEGMDLDEDDIDIYGTSEDTGVSAMARNANGQTVPAISLTVCDSIEHYGSIRDMVTGLVGDDSPPEVVASTGAGPTAGLTIFHRSLSLSTQSRVELPVAQSSGLWLLRAEIQPCLVLCDSQKTTVCSWPALNVLRTLAGRTLAITTARDGHSLIRVTTARVELLDLDCEVLSEVAFSEPTDSRSAHIEGDTVFTTTEEFGSVEAFTIDTKTRRIAPITSAPASCQAMTACIDHRHELPLIKPPAQRDTKRNEPKFEMDDTDELYGSKAGKSQKAAQTPASLEQVLSLEAGKPWEWSVSVSAAGSLEIYLMPSMQLVFTAEHFGVLSELVEDGASVELPDELDREDLQIESVRCVTLGASRPKLHLLVLLRNGTLAVYEAVPAFPLTSRRDVSLGARFVKVAMRRFNETPRRTRDSQFSTARRDFVCGQFGPQNSHAACVTGEEPVWIVCSDHGPARIVDAADKSVYGLAALDSGYVLIQDRENGRIGRLPTDICVDADIPYTRIRKDRRYAGIAFDLDSGLYVGGALFESDFMLFDDEGKPVFTNDKPDMTNPKSCRSALELIVPGTWEAIDGYEFRPNEFIATLKTVSLATRSTETRRKDFIAVGTAVYRGEDLSTRGGIYLFEVIKTNPEPEAAGRTHQLKLRTFEDAKSAVSNVCDINGHLILSLGQKLYARAFEQDEVLINVGFLDIGMHVASMQSMKNFLLLGDIMKSVSLIAFQEEPFKLVMLGKDFKPARTANVTFLINDSRVAFVAGDESGVLRLLNYDPTSVASQGGQKLLVRTEYNAGTEALTTLMFARRQGSEDPRQNCVLYGGVDGSLFSLVPVRDIVFKRLQLLQTALARHVQHFAGLNPRGNRIVKNDSVSRAITRGVLDGELLAEFEWLPLHRQVELATAVGTDQDTLLANLRSLSALW
ncbi:hypothetical protein ACM66B_000255 [Microbotryomycetes sp. NB124-2]